MKKNRFLPLKSHFFFTVSIFILQLTTGSLTYARNSDVDSPFCTPTNNNLLNETTEYHSGTGPALFLIHPNVKVYNLGTTLYGIFKTYADFQQNLPKTKSSNPHQSFFFLDSEDYNEHIFPTCHPNKFVLSKDGHNNIQFRGNTAIFIGGFFSACLRIALTDFIKNWKPNIANKNLSIIFPVSAIYENYQKYSLTPSHYDVINDPFNRSMNPFYEAYLSTTFDFKSLFRYIDFISIYTPQRFVDLFWERMTMYFTPDKNLFINNVEQTGISFHFPKNYNITIDARFNIEHPPFSKLPGGTMIYEKRAVVNTTSSSPTITMYFVDEWGMTSLKQGNEVDWN